MTEKHQTTAVAALPQPDADALAAALREAEKREAAAAAAMRDAAKRSALDVLIPEDASAAEGHGRSMASIEAAMAIAALPLPHADALAAALREAEKRGIQAAARIAYARLCALLDRSDAEALRREIHMLLEDRAAQEDTR